jgi:hypothetical protein
LIEADEGQRLRTSDLDEAARAILIWLHRRP